MISKVYAVGALKTYKYVVVLSTCCGKIMLSRHKQRTTWETQGGHIEAGETPLECARRELFEESGIKDADVYPVCDYWGFDSNGCANGRVFLAVAKSLGELPESEMKAVRAFDTLPENLTYPQVTPRFCYVIRPGQAPFPPRSATPARLPTQALIGLF